MHCAANYEPRAESGNRETEDHGEHSKAEKESCSGDQEERCRVNRRREIMPACCCGVLIQGEQAEKYQAAEDSQASKDAESVRMEASRSPIVRRLFHLIVFPPNFFPWRPPPSAYPRPLPPAPAPPAAMAGRIRTWNNPMMLMSLNLFMSSANPGLQGAPTAPDGPLGCSAVHFVCSSCFG